MESVPKIQLLLSLRKPGGTEIIMQLLKGEIAKIKKSYPNTEYRLATRTPGDPTASVPQDGLGFRKTLPPSFDVWLELTPKEYSIANLIESLKDLGRRLEPQIDRSQSAVLVGQEHTIVAGTESLLLIMAIRRRSHLSSQEFHDFWRNDHASHVQGTVSDLEGYRQFHAEAKTTKMASGITGLEISDLEGTAEGYYSNLDKFFEIMASSAVSEDAGFIDHNRSVMWLYSLTDTSGKEELN